MFEAIKARIRGINAINITPFREDGAIDEAALGRNLDDLVASGIEAIYPCGNTGEFYSLTLGEARRVTQLAVERVAGRAAVMAGIGYDTRTAAVLAESAAEAGADGLMLHQPVHPFQSERGLLAYYREVAASTSLPIVLYVRHESVGAELLREATNISNIIGVKYAVNHLPSFAAAVQAAESDPVWICGTAELWAPFFFAAGAVGYTSGLVNVEAQRSQALLAALRAGDTAESMRIWAELRPFELLRERERSGANVSVVKEAMAQLGRARADVRPPIAPLTERERQEIAAILDRWGLTRGQAEGSV
ncbi:dihydrodipicolinate synthase family protein [Paenibacillus sp. IB182496]|uniref:Dihydrodipicolinate synthase family protein n=1 Tax=Paenibacillus sabuli TaxID=2772509 RepID=A0A927BW38_9BACL|nr:dihydrodipicolinate synthase family protein [Paenibacillus sabuli]MBD2847931.1 dihydrodipicolinate synthase family protein [Paenibacillus sabuli]